MKEQFGYDNDGHHQSRIDFTFLFDSFSCLSKQVIDVLSMFAF